MPITTYYCLSKGRKAIGENGVTGNPSDAKKFASIEEASDWLAQWADAPNYIYTVTPFIEKTAEEL
jgi:hypothetical protein